MTQPTAEPTAHALPPEVRMGNDIVRALRHLPSDAAMDAVVAHLRRFWDPRMRRAIVARVRQADPDIDPLLAEAIRTRLEDDITVT